MAAVGNYSRSVMGGSDESFDYICTSCEKKNKTVEAGSYCTECDECYCQICIEFHEGFPALKNHQVLGRDNLKCWGHQRRSATIPTDPCSTDLQMFCGQHNEHDCHVCVSLEHRACKGMQHVPEEANEHFLASEHSPPNLEVTPTRPEVKVKKHEQNNQLCKLQNGRDYNVKLKSDSYECDIFGCCQMPDNTLLITDFANSKLKQVNASYQVTSYQVISHCDLPCGPLAVCCIGQQEAAVTDDNKTVHFVSVTRNKMTVIRSIKLNHYCYGLAYNDERLYVSDQGKKVYIYNSSGTCLSTIYKDNNGEEIFESARYIAVSVDGTKIYVADSYKGLVTLDSSGQLLSTFCDERLRRAHGVCVDGQGRVLVCGWASHNVIQVDEGGKTKIGEIVTRTDGINHPSSVCLDRHKTRLMVTMNFIDTIKIFDMLK